MKKLAIIIISVLLISGCGKTKLDKYKEIMDNNEYIILDVRTKEEFNESHVVDAINIPYDEIDENINIDNKLIIFVYCKSGNRSNIAKNTLQILGYTVYDLGAFDSIDLPKE